MYRVVTAVGSNDKLLFFWKNNKIECPSTRCRFQTVPIAKERHSRSGLLLKHTYFYG